MKNYNSKYPSSYYELGKPYRFYTESQISGEKAPAVYVKKYKSCFNTFKEEKEYAVMSDSAFTKQDGSLKRFIGVVVEHSSVLHNGQRRPSIKVMFQSYKSGKVEYRVKNYIVSNDKGVQMDGQNVMKAETILSIQKEPFSDKEKKSGITKANGQEGVSGITSLKKDKPIDGISGVTAVHESSKTSGITKVN